MADAGRFLFCCLDNGFYYLILSQTKQLIPSSFTNFAVRFITGVEKILLQVGIFIYFIFIHVVDIKPKNQKTFFSHFIYLNHFKCYSSSNLITNVFDKVSTKVVTQFSNATIVGTYGFNNRLEEIRKGNVEQVKYLLDKNGLVRNADWSDYYLLKTALHYKQTAITKLLQKGARVNKIAYSDMFRDTTPGTSPLHYLSLHGIFFHTNCFNTKIFIPK